MFVGKKFVWSRHFVEDVLKRGAYPTAICELDDTKKAIEDAIIGLNPAAAIVDDIRHGDKLCILPLRESKLASASFKVDEEGGIVFVKNIEWSQKPHIDARKQAMAAKAINGDVTSNNKGDGEVGSG